jgi:hypothetical protein
MGFTDDDIVTLDLVGARLLEINAELLTRLLALVVRIAEQVDTSAD